MGFDSKTDAEYGSPRATQGEDSGVGDVARHVDQVREQATRYFAAQLARIQALARSAVLFGILGIAVAFVGLTIVVVACVLFCSGIAGGIAQLLGGRQWAGDLITGAIILGTLLVGGYFAVLRIIRAARKKTVTSWAERRTKGPVS